MKNILQGMVMGIAEIIPGVSGSTLALIMGVYEDFIDLLHQVSNFAKELIKFFIHRSSVAKLRSKFWEIKWGFGIKLGLGMVIAIALLSNVISAALETYPQYMFALFFGLIIASIPLPWAEIKSKDSATLLLASISTVVTFLLLGMRPIETATSPSLILMFIGGVVGISGMVLPGISGSFILLILGLYSYIVDSVKLLTRLNIELDRLLQLAIFSLGLIVGFMVFVRFLKVALVSYRDWIMAIIIGLMLGSLRVLWPFFSGTTEDRQNIWPWEMPAVDLVIIALAFLASVAVVHGLRKLNGSPKNFKG